MLRGPCYEPGLKCALQSFLEICSILNIVSNILFGAGCEEQGDKLFPVIDPKTINKTVRTGSGKPF